MSKHGAAIVTRGGGGGGGGGAGAGGAIKQPMAALYLVLG